MKKIQTDLLPGTIDLLALKTLQSVPAHGWDIDQRIRQVSQDVCGRSVIVVFGAASAGNAMLDRFPIVRKQSKGEILQTGLPLDGKTIVS
jgi:hypothetical protein